MTEAGLCNLALLRVGQRQTIQALTDVTPEARACKTAFANARDVVLGSFEWGFATRRKQLALLANVERSGWTYVYSAPTDMQAPCYLWSGVRNPGLNQRVPFSLEDGNPDFTGQILLTDKPDAELVYIANDLGIGLYPPLVADAVAWFMAADLALGWAVKPALASQLQRAAMVALQSAQLREANKPTRDAQPESEFVRGR
jgi:hypothetical protein